MDQEHSLYSVPRKGIRDTHDLPGLLTGLGEVKGTIALPHTIQDGPGCCNITDEDLLPMILNQLENLGKKHNERAFLDLVGLGQADNTAILKRFEEFWPWIIGGLQGTQENISALKSAPSIGVFRAEYLKDGMLGIRNQLRQTFQAFNANYKFSDEDMLSQAAIADLRYPTEWYPEARVIQRTIHLHVGPTNSGKTYHALKRLEQAESGVYAGPLRLLAHEVFSRLNAKGKACNLVTGDEQIMVQDGEEDATMSSCTVEMLALSRKVDVAVIDEIQMMAHPERGWAWTQALLGLAARELHLCGEARSIPIIKELIASIGDKLVIHNYNRLNPLEVERKSLQGRLDLLRKGDAIIVFSKVGIHSMKKAIERATRKRVAIVYGALPPEIRAQQARLFNDENNDYDFLVASDAIGMGLNLNIKRIVFESIRKFNGSEKTILPISEIKQIAGRAGRYKHVKNHPTGSLENVATPLYESLTPPSTEQLPGYVTCFDGRDLPFVAQALNTNAPPIAAVGVIPPEDLLQRFASHFPPQTPYSYVMLRMFEFARLNPRFFLCDLRDQMRIADALRPVMNLTISDLMVFCASPATFVGEADRKFLQAMASCVAEQQDSDLLDLLGNELEVLDQEISPRPEYMTALEVLHRNLVLYIWLSYRFGTFFRQRPMATHAKTLVEDSINKVLSEFSSVKVLDAKFKKLQKQALTSRRVELERPSELTPESPSAFDGTEFTTPSEEKTIHYELTYPQRQLPASYLGDTSKDIVPIRKFVVLPERYHIMSRLLAANEHPEVDEARGGIDSATDSAEMAQVPQLVAGLESNEANAERFPLDEDRLAARRPDEDNRYDDIKTQAENLPLDKDFLAARHVDENSRYDDVKANAEGSPLDKNPLIAQRPNDDSWYDDEPLNHSGNQGELMKNHKEVLVASRGNESSQSRDSVMNKAIPTGHTKSRVSRPPGSTAQETETNYDEMMATSDPEAQKQRHKESKSPDGPLASNFFNAFPKQSHASEAFIKCCSPNGKGTDRKDVAKPGAKYATPKSSPHQSTIINILNSLIRKAPSFRHRMEELRR